MRKFLAVSKPIATWLVAWMVVFTIPAYAVNTQRTVSKERTVPNIVYDGHHMVNVGFDPVDPERQVNWDTEDEYVLQDWAMAKVRSGSGNTVRGWLSPGTALAVSKDGRGTSWIVACGNPVTMEGTPRWKQIVRQCPVCPPQDVRTIEVPGPERVVYEPRERESYVPPPSDNRRFCARGGWRTGTCIIGGLLVGGGIVAATRGGTKKCSTCAGGARPAP